MRRQATLYYSATLSLRNVQVELAMELEAAGADVIQTEGGMPMSPSAPGEHPASTEADRQHRRRGWSLSGLRFA